MSADSVRMSMPSNAALSRSICTSTRGLSIFRSLSRKMKRLLSRAFVSTASASSCNCVSEPVPPITNSPPPPPPPALGSAGGTWANTLRPVIFDSSGWIVWSRTCCVERLRSPHGFSTKPAMAVLVPAPPLMRKKFSFSGVFLPILVSSAL